MEPVSEFVPPKNSRICISADRDQSKASGEITRLRSPYRMPPTAASIDANTYTLTFSR